jgi:hypothetical protein
MAEVKRYAVVTQLSKMASIRNSCPMEGRAILTEDIPKGERKAANAVTNKTNLLVPASSSLMASIVVNISPHFKPSK